MSNLQKLKILLWSSRPVSWINTAFPFAAGYLFTHRAHTTLLFWVATFYFLIPYNMMVYVVNDVFDYESDLRNPRKGGVEGALLPKELHRFMLWAVLACNLPFLAFIYSRVSLYGALLLVAIVFDALAYSVPYLRYKERPVIDSMSSSFHFVSPLLFALSLASWRPQYLVFILAFFFWGMASHAFGAVQDIIPDRAAKISSIATRFGASRTVRLSMWLYIASILLVASQGWPAVLVACAALPYVAITAPYRGLSDKKSGEANQGWKHFMKINQLVGFVVTVLLILSLR